MKTRILTLVATGIVIASTLSFVACSDDNAVTEPPHGTSGGTTSSSGGQSTSGDAGNPKDCFDPPLDSHLKIINACTNADKVVRTTKSKYLVDGGALPKP